MVDDVEEGRVNSYDCGWQKGVLDNHAAHLALDFRHRLHSNCGAIVVALI